MKIKNTLVLATFTFFGITSSYAQNPTRDQEKGRIPGIPYASSDIESINLTNGNLAFSFPLGTLPSGRGQASASLFLRYNSKLWKKRIENILLQNGQESRQSFLGRDNLGGWNYGENYSLRISRRDDGLDEPTPPCDNGPNFNAVYKWRVQIEFPDGSMREFRPTSYSNISPFSPTHGNSIGPYFNVSPTGRIDSLWWATTGGAWSCGYLTAQDPNPYMTYYSSDNSGMQLKIYRDGNGQVSDWEVSMPDGSRIINTQADGERIYDRNGNYVQYGNVTLPDGTQATGWIDQFGRYTAKKATSSTEDTIYQLGFNGQMTTTKVRWKSTTVIKKYRTDCADCDHERGQTSYQVVRSGFRVIDNIETPNGLTYTFDYYAHNGSVPLNPSGGTTNQNWSPGWGEVKSLTMPSTAKTTYNFEIYEDPEVTNTGYITPTDILDWSGRTTEKKVSYNDEYDGVSTPREDKWIYHADEMNSSVYGPNGSITTQSFYNLNNDENLGGHVYRETAANGTITEKLWRFNNPSGFNPGKPVNPYVKTEFVTIPDTAGHPSLTAIKDFDYDKNGNVTRVAEYDWVSYSSLPRDQYGYVTGVPGGIAPKRVSQTDFYNPTPNATDTTTNSANAYWSSDAPRLRNLAASAEVQDSSGTPKSRSEITYDYTSYSGNTLGGNPTATKTWDSTKGAYSNPLTTANSISTTAQYDSYGNPTLTTDAKGNQTQITYGSVGGVTGLYPTQIISAYTTSMAKTSSLAYDFYTGAVTTATDVDNNVSVVTEYDALGRPTKVRSAANTALESWTRTEYDDVNRRVVVRSDLETIGDGRKVATQFYDQLGRVRLAKTLEDVATQSPYNETDGIKVQTRYQTGNPNSYQLSSNPYRASSATSETDLTMGWTRSKSVNTGRHGEVETFSGAALPAPWGTNTNSTGKVQTDIDADRTLVTDQTGKQRISRTNALGQLKDVWEVTASDQWTETISFPNQSLSAGYRTSYNYDTLNNLTTVNQGAQTRTFSYNSLSRLLSATNPELGTTPTNGTISYQYDNNGNLTQKTDPRAVVTSYIYDALNRVTNRNYTAPAGLQNYQATPNVSYFYDGANVAGGIANSKGKLTKVTNGTGTDRSTTEYTEFDILGRVKAHKQTTDGTAYTTGYTYNLAGALIEETYPSGRVVKNRLDNDGMLQQVQSKRANDTFRNYANGFTYTAAGAVASLRLGNGKWESTQFNSRLQPTQIGLGASAASQNLLKLNYDYGTTDNNGNVKSQTINTGTATFTQSYLYDSLNRLTEAKEVNVSNQQTWKQNFGYDRFGNRTSLNEYTGNDLTNNQTPQIDASNNRFTTASGFVYDLSGNVITDNLGRTFNYDGENKQTKVQNGASIVGEYKYDGNGSRVKKIVGSEVTIFVYDAASKLVAEYSTTVEPATTAKISYTTADTLGSPRIITDQLGNVISRRDFKPYGEEISRTNYGSDSIRQKFTGYEKDDETGLDFAQTRYLGSNQGRFMTPDSFTSATHVSDPQSWNLYSYVSNNPLKFVDPLGKKGTVSWYTDENGVVQITLKASFAIYGAKGQNVSKADLETYKKALTTSIKELLTKQGSLGNGQRFSMTTDISAKVYENEDKAIGSGRDNIVELGYDDLTGQGDSSAVGISFGVKTEGFDRMAAEISHDPSGSGGLMTPMEIFQQSAAHEFAAHLLSALHGPSNEYGLFSGEVGSSKVFQSDIKRLVYGYDDETYSDPPPPLGQKYVPTIPNYPPLTSGSSPRLANNRNYSAPSDAFSWTKRVKQ